MSGKSWAYGLSLGKLSKAAKRLCLRSVLCKSATDGVFGWDTNVYNVRNLYMNLTFRALRL